MTLLEKDRQNIWHPYTSLQPTFEPLLITSAQGAYLQTHDGKKIIDAISSWWVNLHGHSNPVIAKAIAQQASKLEHVIFAGFTHEPAIQLSENLLSILPANQSKIFFSDNGSTAVEVALKMAIQYWRNQGNTKRKKIIAFNDAYHGDTFGAMAVGGKSIFTNAFDDYLFEVIFIDVPFKENEKEVIEKFIELIRQENVAAFIYEPLVQGAAGMRIYPASGLEKILNLAKQYEVITIADEVFTGFGRTGKMFASDYINHQPDLITLSKGITGGSLPLGVTSCSRLISEAFNSPDYRKTFYHGHSYTANPLACAAANASFGLTISSSCQQAINQIGEKHSMFVKQMNDHPKIKSIKSLGTILSIELTTDESTGYVNNLRNTIYPYFLEKGILLRPLGNVLYVLPPYVITIDELDWIQREIWKFLN